MGNNVMRLPFHFAKRHGVFLQGVTNEAVVIAHLPNLDPSVLIELSRFYEMPLELVAIAKGDFEKKLAKAYETTTSTAMEAFSDIHEDLDLQSMMDAMPKAADLLETEDDAPVIRLINAILTQAIKQSASDIHFETYDEHLLVRFRVDGVLHEALDPPKVLAPLLTSRVKVMAKLDIAEKRLPQDGRISLRIAGRAVDVRVSTVPTNHGERIVLRLLDKESAPLDLAKLGMANKTLDLMKHLIRLPHGILLVTGPTGSGKSTTLYAVLNMLNNETRNILTIEDPIEYDLPGVGQMQVNTKIGMTFSRGLRAILRQDPDVVMVGEIRDIETVEMAIQASLTGHLVLSTLHTNTAIGAITRLRDMGAEPFLLSSTIVGVLAQRLVRVLCSKCKRKVKVDADMAKILRVDVNQHIKIYEPVGCDQCGNTGYQGRTGIHELVVIDENLRKMIHNNDSEADMQHYAHRDIDTIQQDGFNKVLSGLTTIEEVLRVAADA